MAADAASPAVKAANVGSGRLPGSHRGGTPFSSKSAITSSPIQTRSTPRSRRYGIHNDRDSDSSLSDVDVVDSEAETERLHLSPQKQPPKMVVQRADNTATSIPVDSAEKDEESADLSKDDTREESPGARAPNNKKRKRDDAVSPNTAARAEDAESAPPPQPPKKKVYTPVAEDHRPTEPAKDDAADDGEIQPVDDADVPNGDEGARPEESNDDTQDQNDDDDNHGDTPDDGHDGDHGDDPADAPAGDDAPDAGGAAHDDDEDAERALKKKQAMEDLAEIEKIFAKLKDSIYNEKLRRVDFEQKLLEEGTHPEYVAQKACIDQRLEDKVRLANAQYKYGMEALETATRVSRAQIHSQYFQKVRQLREDMLYECNELWYHIQRERRLGDALVPEYTYRIPERQSTRIKQRMQYNWEVQILNAVSKHIGFPAAPDVSGATEEEMAEDLEELGISPRASVRPSVPPNLRLDEHYERHPPHHWPQAHPSPPEVVPYAGHQAHVHPHTHRHQHPHGPHHHHHHRPHHVHAPPQQANGSRQDQMAFGTRRTPSNNLGAQPSPLPLSQLLQQSSEGGVKMEGQPQQMPLPPLKNTESFSNFSNHYAQQQAQLQQQQPQQPPRQSSFQHNQYSREQQSSSQSNAGQPRDHDADPFRRSKDDMSMDGTGAGGRMSFAYRTAGRGYA